MSGLTVVVPVPVTFSRRIHVMLYGRALSSLLAEPWDLVHCWEEPFVAAAAQIAHGLQPQVPLVIATFQNIAKRYPPPFNWLERRALRRVAAAHVCSETVRELLRAKGFNKPVAIVPFGVDTEADWQVGGPLVHRGEWQGKPYEDKGTILRLEPPTLLVHSHWSPASGSPDAPENYQQVRWSLAERGGGTELTIEETNLPSEEARAISASSWEMVLNNLKELVEGTPTPETP